MSVEDTMKMMQLWEERKQAADAILSSGSESSPIVRLPDDLLGEIFLYIYTPEDTNGYTGRSDWKWLVITHVCRWWRCLALQLAALWKDIRTSNLDCLKAYLERSQTSSIKVNILTPRLRLIRWDAEFVRLLLPHSDRIVSLSVTLNGCNTNAILHMFSHHSFNNINQLSISTSTLPTTITLAPFKVNGCLTSLTLDRIIVLWDTTYVYDNLRELKLINQDHVGTEEYLTMDVFLDMLQRCHYLEQLVINNSGPKRGSSSERKIQLHCLRSLKLDATNQEDICNLLTHLDIPIQTAIEIYSSYNNEHDTLAGLNALIPVDTSGLPHVQEANILEMFVDVIQFVIHVRSWNNVSGSIYITVEWIDDDDPEDFPDIELSYFRSIHRIFSGSPVTHISITSSLEGTTYRHWMDTLSSFPMLTNLELYEMGNSETPGHWSKDIFLVLGSRRTNHTGFNNASRSLSASSQLPDIICPQLEHLRLTYPLFNTDVLEVMENSFRKRVERGGPRFDTIDFRCHSWVGPPTKFPGWPDFKPFAENFHYLNTP
ncbi:hypothetical protein ABKN59_011995 [Abortiporus biennis]